MLDAYARRLVDPVLDAMADRLARRGCPATALTLAGFTVGFAALPAIAYGCYALGLLAILLNRLCDGLDGAVARRQGPTDLGGYLDIVCDFIFYAAVVFGFALAEPGNTVPAALLLFSFMGTGSSFLAFAAVAARRGLAPAGGVPKAIHYLGGLTEGTETMIAFALFCLLPEQFPLLAVTFALLCWLTTLSRIHAAWRQFGREAGATIKSTPPPPRP